MTDSIALELIEDVIFWEKHTEIYDSLEKTLGDKYIVSPISEKDYSEKDGIKAIIGFFISAQMDQVEDYRSLENSIQKLFNIQKK